MYLNKFSKDTLITILYFSIFIYITLCMYHMCFICIIKRTIIVIFLLFVLICTYFKIILILDKTINMAASNLDKSKTGYGVVRKNVRINDSNSILIRNEFNSNNNHNYNHNNMHRFYENEYNNIKEFYKNAVIFITGYHIHTHTYKIKILFN